MRRTRALAKVPLLLFLGLGSFLLPQSRSAAAQDAGLWRTEDEWQRAFEQFRKTDSEFRVESVQEFKRISNYYNELASDGLTLHSFRTVAGDFIRCVDISTQRSFLRSAPTGTMPVLAPVQPPAGVQDENHGPEASADSLGALFGLDGSKDEEGNLRICPSLTFPKLIPKLSSLYHFRKVEEIFQKYPDGYRGTPPAPVEGRPTDRVQAHGVNASGAIDPGPEVHRADEPPSAPTNHEYAHAYQWINNVGSQADFNLWSPFVEQDDEFSLSQLWVTRGNYSDNSLQTVEAGWQVFRGLYGDSKAHLFIYSTSAAYTSGSGCYNLGCSRFVQTDASVVIAGSFSNYSSAGGQQYQLTLAVYRDPSGSHDWWLRVNGTWVGYYPNSLFNANGLTNLSDKLDFGGEIVNVARNGVHTTTQMGSGHFPSEGWQHAAFTKKIQFWDTNANAYNATGLSRDVTNAAYYDLQLNASTNADWLQYFYFGGPGGVSVTCTYSINPVSVSVFSSGGTGSVTVQASDPSCSWSSTSNASWIHVTGGSSGSGNGTVSYSVDANAGAVRSGTISIAGKTFTVNEAGASTTCAAVRSLPGGYAAGQAVSVAITTTPPSGSANHALEEAPPSGWVVSGIDNGGVWDGGTGKVKWGPYFDTQGRTLHYVATPPSGATGTVSFQGVISIDGVPQAICGDSSLSPGAYHPADSNSNWRIDINEATAYGSAWKQGATWPKPPNPIPIDYVTNAGYLWKLGETYHYDASKSPPWAPGANPSSPLVNASDGVVVSRRAVGGAARRSVAPTGTAAGGGLRVVIDVAPAATTLVWAVEDAPPPGWVISAIDSGGRFDPNRGTVKWGPFFDHVARPLSYTVTPQGGGAEDAPFAGVVSFNGASIAICGERARGCSGSALRPAATDR